MSPEQRQNIRRLLARQARELTDWLSKYPEEMKTRWHREAVAANVHLRSALAAELKVCSDGETASLLSKKLSEVKRALDDVDDVGATSGYLSLRMTLRDLRDEAHADPTQQLREHALGLIYDAMWWTPPSVYLTAMALTALGEVLSAVMEGESIEQYTQLRKRLMAGGFNCWPQMDAD